MDADPPEQRKAPIDWAKWLMALSSVVGRSLR